MLSFTANFIFSQSWELEQSFTSSGGGDFGYAIHLSGDGNVLAIGAYDDDTTDTNAGKVQVFQKTSSGWQQMGSDLLGASSSDYFGKDVSLSADGQILAVGIPGSDGNGMYSGEVKIYKYDGNDWAQTGNSIYGDSWEFAGKAISLNNDGSVLAVGIYNNDDNGDDAGVVRIYQYGTSGWTQKGSEIYGTGDYDYFGGSVSINGDGNTFIAGAGDNGSGAVDARVFTYVNSNWEQVGNTLKGETSEDDNFGHAVDIDNSGEKVAVGAIYANNDYGSAQLFKIVNDTWEQQGSALTGNNNQSSFGTSIALNNDGTRMAVGASGYVKVFDFDGNDFTQVGPNITPDQSNDYFGYDISISDDGNTIAIGGGGNYVAIYSFLNIPVINTQPQDQTNICVGSEVNFTIVATNVTSYQWQVSTDNGTNWSDVNDNNVYSGATTDTLTVQTAENMAGYQYRCVLNSTDGSVTSDAAILSFDNEPPVVNTSFPDVIIGVDENCEAVLPDYIAQIDVTDNCTAVDDINMVQTPAPGTAISGNTNTVNIKVSDEAGNETEITFNVSVQDQTAPVIQNTIDDKTLEANDNCEAVLPDYTSEVVANDNCTETNALTITQTPAPGSSVSGANVSIEVTDEAGNSSSIGFRVNVIDTTPPVFLSTHSDQEIAANDNCQAELPDYTLDINADDNCQANFMPVQTPAPGTLISGDSNTVSLTIEDEAGNTASVSFNVAVVDQTPPVLICPDNQMLDANTANGYLVDGSGLDVSATDNCSGIASIKNDFNNSDTLDGAVFPVGVTDVVWTVTDSAGNESQCSFYVDVSDTTGIKEWTENGMKVYPNPFYHQINLNFDEALARSIILQDITGKIVWQKNITEKNIIIETKYLQSGIYLLSVSTDSNTITGKIIKK